MASSDSKETIVVGFSRGAVIAREFVNRVHKERGTVDFLGLYDSVGSFGNPLDLSDKGYCKSIPDGVKYCAQALSIHEERFTFRVIRVNLARSNQTTVVQEAWFPGVHSDIGGTLNKGLGAVSLSWMFEQAAKAGIEQMNKKSVSEAKAKADCTQEPSKNKVSLPASFLKKYRTRIIRQNDVMGCPQQD